MTKNTYGTSRRLSRLLGAGVLLAGGAGASMLFTAGIASATGCNAAPVAGGCTMNGTLDLTAGDLAVAAPASLSWSSALTGYDLNLVDSTHDSFTVIDPTGSGNGWNVTAAATTFTHSSHSLPDSGTLEFNGNTTNESDSTAPVTACDTNSTCTAPATSSTGGPGSTNSVVSYPVVMDTASSSPTAYVIENADAASGGGANVIAPVGWWLNVPGDSTPDSSYGSTITLVISSGPATIS